MKYLYFDNVSGSWDGAYDVANDLVLAKKYLFNCAVSEIEGGNDYFDDVNHPLAEDLWACHEQLSP